MANEIDKISSFLSISGRNFKSDKAISIKIGTKMYYYVQIMKFLKFQRFLKKQDGRWNSKWPPKCTKWLFEPYFFLLAQYFDSNFHKMLQKQCNIHEN